MISTAQCYRPEIERKRSMDHDFKEPTSLDEAESRRDELVAAIQNIQNQLGSRNRTDHEGRRLTYKEYSDWRTRAQHSHVAKSAELRFVNRWIKRTRKEAYDSREKKYVNGALHLVRRMHKMITQLQADGVELEPDELAQVKEAEQFLRLYGKEEEP